MTRCPPRTPSSAATAWSTSRSPTCGRRWRNIQDSGARLPIATTFIDRAYNLDARTGCWRTLNLQAPPFAFGAPLLIVDERCTGRGGRYRDKRLAVWPLASLQRGG